MLVTKKNPLSSISISLLLLFIWATISGCEKPDEIESVPQKVEHVIVIYMENHSFDNLYGQFPNANGLSNYLYKQVDSGGTLYTTLPPVPGLTSFPNDLPNQPWNIDQYIPSTQAIPDLTHKYYQNQQQINGGKNDKFVYVSNQKALALGYYKTSLLPLAAEAANYTLCDNFFQSAFGGSFLNHIWMIAAATPVFPNAPANMKAVLDSAGRLITDGVVTPDGYVVNTAYSVNAPRPAGVPTTALVPYQTMPTIGDRLSEKNIDWAWYAGGWNDAMAGRADPTFQYHHQPFIYFSNYAAGTGAKQAHLKDEKDFISNANAGTLPAVSFVKPIGRDNSHPGYANLIDGENHAIELINAVRNGPNWKSSVIIVTYDENGGFWDHAAPPIVDRWGPGSRVPTLIISPFAKKGFVDHTSYETVSILKYIEELFGLTALTQRDKNANSIGFVFR